MLHGLGADSQSWGFQVPLLVQSGYRVVTLDLPVLAGQTR
jgi:pimeloyl-ACP methyl ester carboxylesterase